MHFGQILDPHSHLSTDISLAHLCEVVQSLGHLPRISNLLDAFWSNIAPLFAFIY